MKTPTRPADLLDQVAPVADATPGHNNPPPYDPAVLDELGETVTDFMAATQDWLDLKEIATEQQAEQLTDQISGLRALWKKVDDARKAAKKPHDDAGTAVQKAFAPYLTRLKKAADALKPKLGAYVEKKAAREAEERRLAEEAARKLAEEAERQAREAEKAGNLSNLIKAEEAEEAAKKAAKKAAKPTNTTVKSASGGGRTIAQRKVKVVEITNVRILFMHYQNHPDVHGLLTRLATAEVRAKDYDQGKPVPGITVREKVVVA